MKHVLDPPTPQVREQMRRARRADTGPEVALRKALWAAGLRYRTDYAPLPGLRTRADIAFIGARVLVYVDGCFWHGCPEHATWPKNNAEFWRDKLRRNKERDAAVTAALTAAGWTVLRVWEHEDAGEVSRRIEGQVRGGRVAESPPAQDDACPSIRPERGEAHPAGIEPAPPVRTPGGSSRSCGG